MNRLRELREHLRYRFDTLFAAGVRGQLALLGLLVVAVVLAGMCASLIGLFAEANGDVRGVYRKLGNGPLDAFWWSVSHIVDPAYVSQNYGATLPVVVMSFAISLSGMVVFGMLVSVISAALAQRLEEVRSGTSIVKESGHVLILGWSNKASGVIDLLQSFDEAFRIVVLADQPMEKLQRDLAGSGERRQNRVVLRTGNPAHRSDLSRVAVERASSIVIVADDARGASADLETIKTLMILEGPVEWARRRPTIAAEITEPENVEPARIAAGRRTPVISSDEVLTKILAQSCRQPGLTFVYRDLLSVDGTGIVIRPMPQCVGRTFEELVWRFRHSVPIGISRAVSGNGKSMFVPELNPAADTVLGADEWLVMITGSEAPVIDHGSMPEMQSRGARTRSRAHTESYTILGVSHHLAGIVAELDQYVRMACTLEVFGELDEAEFRERFLTGVFANRVKVVYRQQDYSRSDTLRSLPASNGVLVLADEAHPEEERDGRVIRTLLLLHEQQKRASASRHVVAELLDPRHRDVFTSMPNTEVIVGSELTSKLLTHYSQQPMFEAIYDDLLSAGGMEIYLKPAMRYVTPGRTTTFMDVTLAASQLGEVAIGIRTAAEHCDGNGGVVLNPAKTTEWTPAASDSVVVIATDLVS